MLSMKQARKLADWWDEHQEADRKRIETEKKEVHMKQVRKDTMANLTDEQIEALGINRDEII